MNKQLVAIAVFGVVVVGFFGYWSISNLLGVNNKTTIETNNNDGKPISTVGYNLVNGATNQSTYFGQDTNLTSVVSNDLSSEFISKFQISSKTDSTELISQVGSSDTIQKRMDDIIKESSVDFINTVPDGDLKIIGDNSEEKIKMYGQAYIAILSKFGSILATDKNYFNKALSNAFERGNYSELDSLLANNLSIIKALKELEVPSAVLDFHKQNIIFMKNLSVFLEAIKNVEADPLKAYLVMDKGINLISDQGDKISLLYNQLKAKYQLQ